MPISNLESDFKNFTLLNCYFPSGSSGEHRQAMKMKFLKDFRPYSRKLLAEKPNMIIVGDYNIANYDIDIHSPKTNKKTPGFLPEERDWLTRWWKVGFYDSFRTLYPEKVEYSWWSIRTNARAKNKGWRIDYLSVSEPLVKKLKDCKHLNDVVHSDHCPVLLELK
ncbi:MAG: exodeoxyribonuclease III [Bacteroidota bacterium]